LTPLTDTCNVINKVHFIQRDWLFPCHRESTSLG